VLGFGAGANIHSNIHWMVPRAINSLFTGRSDLIYRVQRALQSESVSVAQKQRRFVITGLGGQGKSEICLQVASLMKQKYVLPMAFKALQVFQLTP
jgi:Mrp family chromosome partitioning ATPase